uniref:Otiwi13 n=1 Tax=Oxytricha trifallax TaxID=94289 RepID=H2DH94_OXYTR|nr:Otiwi13 [Sterkiella histriomuscorum]
MNSTVREEPVNLTIRFKSSFSLNEQSEANRSYLGIVQNFMLNIVKTTLYEYRFKYNKGRLPRFYLATDMVPIQRYDLEMWPSYDTYVKILNDGIFFNSDCATKVFSSNTILDLINELRRDGCSHQEVCDELLPKNNVNRRLVVISTYNSRTYQINDIKFDTSPSKYIFTFNLYDPETQQTTQHTQNLAFYFEKKYGIKIPERHLNQPLLVVHENDQKVYLCPSLCKKVSLQKSFTSNSRKMKCLEDYKLSYPEQRYNRINTLIQRFQLSDVLSGWGLKIDPNFAQVRAKQLPGPQIYNEPQEILEWSSYKNRETILSMPIYLKKETWALLYSSKDYDNANYLVEMLTKASKGLGIKIEEPQYIEIERNDKQKMYIKAMKEDTDPLYTKFVVVILGKNNQKAYIKTFLDDQGIPSQFILSETLQQRGNNLIIFSNILKQINAKLSHDLYKIKLPSLRNTMVIGTNIVNIDHESIIGLCASMNQEISQYYTKTDKHSLPRREKKQSQRLTQDQQESIITEKRSKIICKFIQKSLVSYLEKNKGSLPDQIIIYRDGLGGSSLQEKVKKHEIKEVISTIQAFKQDYDPKIIYCLIDRNTSLRLFYKQNGDVSNPQAGTVLDSTLVENQGDQIYDFFMIPHQVQSATAKPVHFKVAHNTSNLTKEQFEISTYHLCYNYLNVTGPIKTPAPCMYAKKIALYSAANDIFPNENLDFTLHFL